MISEQQISRRRALIEGGLVGAGGLAAVLAACGAAGSSSPGVTSRSVKATSSGAPTSPIEGAWLVTVASPPHQTMVLFTPGGGAVTVSNFAPDTISCGFGAWMPGSDGAFLVTLQLFSFDTSGSNDSLFRVRQLCSVDENGDNMSGRAIVDAEPTGSTHFSPMDSTPFTATRIKALPL